MRSLRQTPIASGAGPYSTVFDRVARKIDSLRGWLTVREAEALFRVGAAAENGCIVEVGSHVGEGTITLCAGSSVGAKRPVYTIEAHTNDADKGGKFGFENRGDFFKLFSKTGLIRYVHLISTTSAVVAPGWRQPISALVFTGVHREEAIAADFAAWRPHLRPNAIIALPETMLRYLNKLIENRTLSFVEQIDTLVLLRFTGHQIALPSVTRPSRITMPMHWPQDVEEYRTYSQRISYDLYYGRDGAYLYQPIPKNACTTVKTLLLQLEGLIIHENEWHRHQKEYNGFPGADHLTLEQQLDIFEGRTDTFKFVIVRNPYARLASAYCDKILVHPSQYIVEELRKSATEQGVKLSNPITFVQFVGVISRQRLAEMNQHWLPQYCAGRFATIQFDFIGRIESMSNDLSFILERIGAPESIFSRVNERKNAAKSSVELWADVPSDVRQQFLAAYDIDFEVLQYQRRLPK
jgi:hypothetical protein